MNKRRSRNTKIARRKKVREKREFKNGRRIIAVGSGILAISLVIYLAGSFLKLPEFPVRDIRIEGLGSLDHMELLRKASISKSTNLLTIDLKGISRSLLTEPSIKETVVLRNFCTGRVSIKLKLRQPVALINCDGIYGIDRDGVVIGTIEELSQSDLPFISGARIQGIRPGERLEQKNVKIGLEVLDCVCSSSLDSFATLSEVNVSNLRNVVLCVGKEGMQIRLGKDSFKGKIDKAVEILADLQSRGKKAEYIDFRFGKKIFVLEKG